MYIFLQPNAELKLAKNKTFIYEDRFKYAYLICKHDKLTYVSMYVYIDEISISVNISIPSSY